MCPIAGIRPKYRNFAIMGRGNLDADILVVHDRLTEQDASSMTPISGAQKEILHDMFSAAGMDFNDAFVTSVIACPTPKARPPLVTEKKNCRDRVTAEVHIVNPRVILLMGSNSYTSLLQKESTRVKFSYAIGSVCDVPVHGALAVYTVPAVITHSPSMLLREADLSDTGIWKEFFDHVMLAKQIAGWRSR